MEWEGVMMWSMGSNGVKCESVKCEGVKVWSVLCDGVNWIGEQAQRVVLGHKHITD